jgi:3-hydroxybutyryl-CoA dehydrogenase
MGVSRVGIVGAGTMGQGIATTCAEAGLEVLLSDRAADIAAHAVEEIAQDLDREIAKWRHTPSEKKAILGRLRAVDGLQPLERADLVIEAVPDELALKVRIFAELDRACPPATILATNTSTLSVTEIAAHTRRPERVIGLHFQNPGTRAPLVEIVRGLKTSDAALATARQVVQALGKRGIEVFEYPGYVTTRVIVPFVNEAMHVVMEGVATAEAVDTAVKLGYGLPVGPLTLADRVGLDELLRWMQHLFNELGDFKYRPCPLLRQMVRAGHLGVKSGRGFFEYDDNGQLKRTERT